MAESHRSISMMLVVLFVVVAMAAAALVATSPIPQKVSLNSTFAVEDDCTPHTEWVEYTLKEEESVETLARQLGMSVEMLSELNCTSVEALGSTFYLPAFPAS